jgi:hypothetical protein
MPAKYAGEPVSELTELVGSGVGVFINMGVGFSMPAQAVAAITPIAAANRRKNDRSTHGSLAAFSKLQQ